MLFPTLEFALFFVVAFTVSWLLRPHWWSWRIAMTGLSLFFYGWWDVRFVALLVGCIVVNHAIGDQVVAARERGDDRAGRRWLTLAVVADLGVLGFFKYAGFFTESLSDLLDGLGLGTPGVIEVVLPVGISFFTFQAMSYVIDLRRGVIDRMRFADFAVYLSFFPQLVAGPIVRASEMAPQLARTSDPRYVRSSEAFELIVRGLFKKVVVSSYLASAIVDDVYALPGEHSAAEVLLATYAYAIQIYADFSGYTDIAIGCALLLGFRFPQNFDAPYVATSLQDFWRRWHMTLSRWLRDYLYISLGGNRRGRLFTYRNLFLTMLLGGLWHGAAWNFVIWGALHGAGLALERLWSEWRPRETDPGPVEQALRWLLTFHLVCAAWVFFRAESADRAFELFGRLDDWGDAPLVRLPVVLVVVAMLAMQFVPAPLTNTGTRWFARRGWVAQAALLGVALVVVDTLGPEGVAPFIYFQF